MKILKKTAGIILAAGFASRMGKTKQLLPFQGTTLLGRVAGNAARSELDEIIVVLGHDADNILKTIDFSGMKTIINKDYKKGQSDSLVKGINAVSPSCAGAMFLLADQPMVTAGIINRMITVFQASDAPILIPFCKGCRGNPVIISRILFPRLLSLSGDTGARVIFDKYKDSILKINFETDAVLLDVDTPMDYENILARSFSGN
ncbi:MAG: molybdenum cofactor cytidylyltransferase [Desulfobacterales bacterium RIFOXYA12_FULL_46_15]|nr:MAG: molybdenum cofactor cytidylyltransferase [Desulfobacula sp. GWF2_41_7]OGR22101.1 MAG: molybdenum cofactor cytidylyltransferase [Desulfobacterales bacterium RIFOXYA12_FULL_46_15]